MLDQMSLGIISYLEVLALIKAALSLRCYCTLCQILDAYVWSYETMLTLNVQKKCVQCHSARSNLLMGLDLDIPRVHQQFLAAVG